MIRLPVFIYGTLRPGEKNYRTHLQGRTLRESPAIAQGELYFVVDGGYPFVIPGSGEVRGELMEIGPDLYLETLHALDDLEGYDTADEVHSVYLRRRTTVCLVESGTRVEAWIYYWNRPQVSGEKISGGDFKKYLRSSGT